MPTIEIKDDDAVIILGSDDMNRVLIPTLHSDLDDVPDNVLLATAITLGLQDEDFIDELYALLPDPEDLGRTIN